MSNLFRSLIVVAASISSNTAFAQESCATVYASSTNSFSQVDVQSAASAYTFDLACEKTGEVKKGEGGLSLNVFEVFKGNIGGAGETQTVSEFCANGVSKNGYREDISTAKIDPVISALKAFNQCRSFESKNLVVSHEINDISKIIINGRFTAGGLTGSISGVSYDDKKMECKSTSVTEDGASVPVSDDQAFPFGNGGFTVTCTRFPQETTGGDYYPSAEVTVVSSWGPSYKASAPSNILSSFDVGSYALARFEEATEKVRVLENQVAEVEADYASARSRIGTINPIAISVHQGDGVWRNFDGSTPDLYVKCRQQGGPDVSDASLQQSWCGAGRRVVSLKRTSSISGGICGHTIWALVCMPER